VTARFGNGRSLFRMLMNKFELFPHIFEQLGANQTSRQSLRDDRSIYRTLRVNGHLGTTIKTN